MPSIRIDAHVQNIGWLPTVRNSIAGTTGNGLKCNNLSSSTSCDLLTSYTSVDEELITFINNTK